MNMASSDKQEVVDRDVNEGDKDEEEKGGFIDKVKDFIHDIGEKIKGPIGFGKPTADVTGIHIPRINLEKADLVVDVLIKNPNPVPIPLIAINYMIESDGRKLIKIFSLEVSFLNYRAGLRITLPLEKTGEVPIPYKAHVDLDKIHFERFSFEETVAVLHMKLENMNDFGLNALDYQVWLADVSIGSAELAKSATIAKKGTSYIDVPITFRPKDFGSALWDVIRGKGTGYTIKGHINVDTPFGAMKLPISREGGTARLKKNKEDGGDDDDDEHGLQT
ncbi:hypothetical protein Tsubulata_036677 [Turnera subulata]|uniref:Water stress and hypersensitive response domain-containing protein n=1 Tax=Turnera subulata TaxID=218843 RepID=A0A9Q0JMT0_9ROSI|nr:hypothetical protein Tsubulata_036677 [Turnera subulata]